MENTKRSPFSKVIQIGIVVNNTDKTIERLTTLGIGPFKEMPMTGEREEWFRGKPMHASFRISFAMLGNL